MTKKKHEAVDGTRKDEAGDVADNMDINSHNKNYQTQEFKDDGGPADRRESLVAGGTKEQDEPGSPDNQTRTEESAEVKLAEMQDRYLRLSAEFDNYRKRTLREKIDLTRHAGENILISIVPVLDDFERALKSMEESADCAATKAGIDLIYSKFRDFLMLNGLIEIESLHTEFNVDLHDAVSKIAVDDENLKGKVVAVLQKGYFLHDKVLRFSKVVVGE
jgi:molecular chaperone GrpE